MGKSSIDQNGFRRQEANPVSMVGVFPYTGEQIDYDGALGLEPKKIYWVFRGPEELFNPEAIKSFNGLPIRVGHVMLGKGFAPVDKESADGCIFNVRQSLDMPEYLIAEFCIYTEKMQDVLNKGKIKELSLGYRCQYVPCVGSYNGKPYEFKQVNLRGNHLALVEHGRCGSSVRVCDQALVTFDSLPKEIQDMDKDENKGIEKAQKLAEAVKNGDEQACQDCLDFYDLTPEQRKEALAYVKGKKADEPKATAEDAKTKDEVPPPPPEATEEKKDDAAAAEAEGAKKPEEEAAAAAAEASKEAPAETAKTEEAPKEEKPTEEAPVVDDCKGKGCKKETKDEAPTVTEASISVPVQTIAEGASAPAKKEEEKEEKKDDAKADAPKADAPKAEDAKCEDGKEEKKTDEVAKVEEAAKEEGKCCAKCEDANGDGVCDSCGKPMPGTKDAAADVPEAPSQVEKPKDDTKEEGKDVTAPKEDAGAKPAPTAEDKGCAISQDQYQAFAAEYANAQLLANAVRPYIKETFDSALMREIDVARFAVKHIESLAFAADEADEVVLGVVRGHVAKIATDEALAKPKTYVMDEAPAVPTKDAAVEAPKVDTKKELAALLNGQI